MTLNPKAKRILFYGDSLVYGKKPGLFERFDALVRFTGVVQRELGDEFEVIEEGLRARMLAGTNGSFPERDGLMQFGPIVGSHVPLHLVVLMLGTNDCNAKSAHKTKEEYEAALTEYVSKIETWTKTIHGAVAPKLLIVAPPPINALELRNDAFLYPIFGDESEAKSRELAPIYQAFCEQRGISFFDAGEACQVAKGEGLHLDVDGNKKLGLALTLIIRKLL